ncbi:MAG: class I SAM-dependent methyltransferase [Sphingomonas sp.]|nr:class I SAM-dependent methyltransferase [Sphingomonas sp.]
MATLVQGHRCRLGDRPRIVLETGHPIAPRVEIWQCSDCGHGVTRPAMDDVAPLYANRASEDYLARDGRAIRALKTFVFRRLARSLLRFASSPVRTVADYGTGNGMLATAFKQEAAPGTVVYALDFFDDPPADLPGVEYRSFARSKPLHCKIDLLTCFHVLEHSDDSDAMLAELQSYVRPGGTLVVEVPNVDCVWTPWFGKSCANWYAPYHRVHFSRQSLRRLFETHGFEIVAERDICGPTFALSLASLLGVKPNGALFLAALALRPIQWAAEKFTRRSSALRIVARVPGASHR